MTTEPAPGVAAAPRSVSLVRSVTTVGSMTLVSRGLGFVRDVLIANLLGAGPLADAFFVAFKLPNFLRRLFAEGAFNAGFVPMFARKLEAEGPAVAKAFAEQAQAVLVGILVPLVLLALPAMPWLITIFTPGFEPPDPRYDAAVELSRITFCYILFISLVALQAGVLNSMNLFGAAAASPVVLNLTLITALGLSAAWLGAPAHALAWSVAAAGLLQFLWLRFSLYRAGMVLAFRRPRLSPEIRRLFALIVPGAVGASAAQISALLDVFFASLLPAGAVSYLYYADRLSQLPLGVIGVAVGTALLPLLARQLRAGDTASALRSQNLAIEMALLLTLPSALALIVLAWPIIHVLFEHGAFGPADTLATSRALAAYAAGLPAYVLIKVLAPGFFAREDTRTPVKVALGCLAANLVLVLILMCAARARRHRARDRALGLAQRRPAGLAPAPRRPAPARPPPQAAPAAHPRRRARDGGGPLARPGLARSAAAEPGTRAAGRGRRGRLPPARAARGRARPRRAAHGAAPAARLTAGAPSS